MISEQYKQQVWRKFENSGFKQPQTKEELDIIIELQSRGQKPSKTRITSPKPVNEVKAFDKLLRDVANY
jgi:hypothetical protein